MAKKKATKPMDKMLRALDGLEKALEALDRDDFNTTNSHRLSVAQRKTTGLRKLLELVEQDEG